MPIYHPAASLYSPKYKAAIKEDFQKIQALMQECQREYKVNK
jgi:uracil-DNA glycosylase